MANTFDKVNESRESESWVRHTSGGEMPDTSKLSTMRRRIQAAMPVMSNEVNFKTVLFPLVAAGIGVSVYYLVRQIQSRQASMPESRDE